MILIDTHSHLYHKQFNNDMDAVLQRCIDANVQYVMLPNIDIESIEAMHQLATRSTPTLQLLPMMGLHPCDVKENYTEHLAHMKNLLDTGTYYGVGETGLDYYWDVTFKEEQKKSLHIQAEWAIEKNLPLIIHSRNSTDDCIEIVSQYKDKLKGIFHCFAGTLEQAQQIIDTGFLLGIGGTLTYKNSGVQEIVKQIDLKNIVLETDAPYLTPVPHRGKRNESSYVKLVAEFMATVKETTVEEIANVTTANAKQLFKLI